MPIAPSATAAVFLVPNKTGLTGAAVDSRGFSRYELGRSLRRCRLVSIISHISVRRQDTRNQDCRTGHRVCRMPLFFYTAGLDRLPCGEVTHPEGGDRLQSRFSKHTCIAVPRTGYFMDWSFLLLSLCLLGIAPYSNAADATNISVGIFLNSRATSIFLNQTSNYTDAAYNATYIVTTAGFLGTYNVKLTPVYITVPEKAQIDGDICNPTGALGAFKAALSSNTSIDALIGPVCIDEIVAVTQLANAWTPPIPVITAGGGFVGTGLPPYWRRLQPCPTKIWPIVLHFMQQQNWRTLCIVSDTGDRGFARLADYLASTMRSDTANFDSVVEFAFNSLTQVDDNPIYPTEFDRIASSMLHRCRIVLYVGEMLMFAEFLKVADSYGYISSSYAYMFYDGHRFPWPQNLTVLLTDAMDTKSNAARIVQNVVAFSMYPELFDTKWSSHVDKIVSSLQTSQSSYTYEKTELSGNVFVLGFSQALNLLVKAVSYSLNLDRMKNVVFNTEATGDIQLDQDGEKVPDLAVIQMNPPQNMSDLFRARIVSRYTAAKNEFSDPNSIQWIGGSAPRDSPPCGFDDPKCARTIALAVIFPLLFLLIFWLLYKLWQYRKRTLSKVHVVEQGHDHSHHHFFDKFMHHNPHDVSTQVVPITGPRTSVINTGTIGVGPVRRDDDNESRLIRWDQVTLHRDLHRGSTGNWAELYEKTSRSALATKTPTESRASLAKKSSTNMDDQIRLGSYKNIPVCLYYVRSDNGLSLDDAQKMDILLTAEHFHANVAQFFGLAIDERKAALVYECPDGGTLYGLLQNTAVTLDLPLRYSFLKDIASGLSYIHESRIRVHGCLSSHTCLVDEYFRIRLTDYGLPSFHRLDDPLVSPGMAPTRYIWIAPEVVRRKSDMTKTQESDVYSLGMVLYHILGRKLPFSGSRVDITGLVSAMETGDSPPALPEIGQEFNEVDQAVVSVMQQCWNEDPKKRPRAASLLQDLAVLRNQLAVAPADDAAIRLRRYLNTLEKSHDERTHGFFREQDKADEILFHIVPPAIARRLKAGETFQAQTFREASVLMSSVVDFPNIVLRYKPQEVVEFLNEVYTLFDGCAREIGITEIESIGDTRIAASGLPEPNPERHAIDIATFSLNLVSKSSSIPVLAIKEELKFRIGISSGPVACGLINLAFPKFCIFGETINSSAKMQALSAPNRIHIASTTKAALEKSRMFDLEMRRDRKISIAPGFRGTAETYWLNGFKVGTIESEEMEETTGDHQAPVITSDPFAQM